MTAPSTSATSTPATDARDRLRSTGRSFVQVGEQGAIDGDGTSGIYANDMRLIRRLEVFRAEPDTIVPGEIYVDEHGCAARFELTDVQPGSGVLLAVELDGTDVFDVRDGLLATGTDDTRTGDRAASATRDHASGSRITLGAARPDARVRVDVSTIDGGVELVDRDGIAHARVPIVADSTPRTGSWRWIVPQDALGPVDLVVELRAAWALSTDVHVPTVRSVEEHREAYRQSADAWRAAAPKLTGAPGLERVLDGSLADLAQLRVQTPAGAVPAAGAPWYMTIFGRDALLTAWMALPADPQLAAATLRHLAQHQAKNYDITVDAEPGKFQHEERVGVAAQRWHARYFGAVDVTPLWLMLLAETTRWTGDAALATELEANARRAVAWILERLEDDELGLISYQRRAERGLDVQSWKDSPASQRDGDGLIASGVLRPLEVQGYAVAALRDAATMPWASADEADSWRREADALQQRILTSYAGTRSGSSDDDDPRAGGFLAQSLDAGGARVDALCSNVGHVLWADALADDTLRAATVAQLQHPALWSGWGVRTMSTLDAGYEPASYHCGSVWPHDTAIAIAGVARTDAAAADRLAQGLIDAAAHLGGHLPELFSGADRLQDGGEQGAADAAPMRVDAACEPQAWAAAAPLLVLRTVLGLVSDADSGALRARSDAAPAWIAGTSWRGVHALGARWDVSVDAAGAVTVVRAPD